jgi:hypothetical protein
MSRYHIIQTIKSAINGLSVYIMDEPRTIKTVDTLINPTEENSLPVFSVTPGPETDQLGLFGFSPLDCTLRIDLFGYTDGGSLRVVEVDRKTRIAKAAEDVVRAIKKKLTDPTFLDSINCEFSIIQIGPFIVEHAELEDPFAYVSMPLTIQYLDDVQTDTQD